MLKEIAGFKTHALFNVTAVTIHNKSFDDCFTSQQAFTYSKSEMETLKNEVKYVQS